jgi:uncharacterized GH25 family protein
MVMVNRFQLLRISVLLGFATVSSCIYAHEVTLFPELSADSIQITARYGDPGQYEKIYKIRLLSFDAFAPNGEVSSLLSAVKPASDELSLTGSLPFLQGKGEGVWVLSSTYDNGFYVHASDGHAIATTLADYPLAADSAHYFKFSKALLRHGQASRGFDRILGHRLELIPKVDPFSVATGATIPIEVRFEGKPLANATVEIGDDQSAEKSPAQKTDLQGIVRISVDHRGWYRLAVTHRAPSKYPELFKFDDLTASLVFQND